MKILNTLSVFALVVDSFSPNPAVNASVEKTSRPTEDPRLPVKGCETLRECEYVLSILQAISVEREKAKEEAGYFDSYKKVFCEILPFSCRTFSAKRLAGLIYYSGETSFTSNVDELPTSHKPSFQKRASI